MKFVAAFILLLGVVASRNVLLDSQLDEEWEKFKSLYGKTYKGQEEAARRQVWEDNLDLITQHNIRSDLGLHSFRTGINKYSDMDHKEFVQKVNGLRTKGTSQGSTWVRPSYVELPETVDWRNQGYVTPIKDQGLCGSCWAFSATGSLEGQHKKKTGKLVSLSEQNLVDCSWSWPDGNFGCFGGFMDKAFEYVKNNNGIDTEEAYPYWIWQEFFCHFKPEGVGATCSGYVDLPKGDEKALQEAVATIGPISVGIDASQKSFGVYSSGIYDDPKCTSDKIDHGVLVVGYGTDNGTDYWLIKNSWGTSWGMDGYGKMIRNKNNHCGIANNASYPLV